MTVRAAKKSSLFLLLLLAASTLTLLQPITADPTPSVPQYTIKLVKHSFDLPAIYSTDPFTGNQNVQNGRHWEWRTIDITIKNQPFDGTPEGSYYSYIGIMYLIHFRGVYSGEWQNVSTSTYFSYGGDFYLFPQASQGDYTTVSIMLNGDVDINSITSSRIGVNFPESEIPQGDIRITEGGSAQFQVQALSGVSSRNPVIPFSGYVFTGQVSGWSDIKTLNLADSSVTTSEYSNGPKATASPSNLPTAKPTLPPTVTATPVATKSEIHLHYSLEIDWWMFCALALATVVVLLVVMVVIQHRHIGKISSESAKNAF
jgi:hypothetical protein